MEDVETQAVTVQRTFADLDDYWDVVLGGPSVGPQLRALRQDEAARLRARLQVRLPATPEGRITVTARANAIRGRVGSDTSI